MTPPMTPPTRVLFSGSRTITATFENLVVVEALLLGLNMRVRDYSADQPFEIVHGDARGLDLLVRAIYETHWLDDPLVVEHRCPADWPRCGPDCPPTTSHRRTRTLPNGSTETYCPGAGLRRNQAMLDEHAPDLGLCFIDKPQHLSRGTDDMWKRLKAAHVPRAITQLGGA